MKMMSSSFLLIVIVSFLSISLTQCYFPSSPHSHLLQFSQYPQKKKILPFFTSSVFPMVQAQQESHHLQPDDASSSPRVSHFDYFLFFLQLVLRRDTSDLQSISPQTIEKVRVLKDEIQQRWQIVDPQVTATSSTTWSDLLSSSPSSSSSSSSSRAMMIPNDLCEGLFYAKLASAIEYPKWDVFLREKTKEILKMQSYIESFAVRIPDLSELSSEELLPLLWTVLAFPKASTSPLHFDDLQQNGGSGGQGRGKRKQRLSLFLDHLSALRRRLHRDQSYELTERLLSLTTDTTTSDKNEAKAQNKTSKRVVGIVLEGLDLSMMVSLFTVHLLLVNDLVDEVELFLPSFPTVRGSIEKKLAILQQSDEEEETLGDIEQEGVIYPPTAMDVSSFLSFLSNPANSDIWTVHHIGEQINVAIGNDRIRLVEDPQWTIDRLLLPNESAAGNGETVSLLSQCDIILTFSKEKQDTVVQLLKHNQQSRREEKKDEIVVAAFFPLPQKEHEAATIQVSKVTLN